MLCVREELALSFALPRANSGWPSGSSGFVERSQTVPVLSHIPAPGLCTQAPDQENGEYLQNCNQEALYPLLYLRGASEPTREVLWSEFHRPRSSALCRKEPGESHLRAWRWRRCRVNRYHGFGPLARLFIGSSYDIVAPNPPQRGLLGKEYVDAS